MWKHQTESTPQSQPQTQTAKEAEFDLALQMVNQHPKLQRQVCVALASGANKKLLKTKFQEGYEQGNPNNFPRSSFVWLALETNC